MTSVYQESDADPAALEGRRIAVVGYGNQGRSWALNLRDSGLDPTVCVRADATDEWDAEGAAGYPELEKLREQHAGPAIREMEADMRRRLGPRPRSEGKEA